MTPTAQECGAGAGVRMTKLSATSEGESVVISGMSGLYPKCQGVKQLAELLYNQEDPIGPSRWKFAHPEATPRTGKVAGMDRFDAQFFMVNKRLGNAMEPMSKKILELTYQAIFDAGINPEQLNGKNVGVFIGTSLSESEKIMFFDMSSGNGFGISGNTKTMFANRISYWLNTKGPSLAIDAACCSSLVALEQAYLAMERGECDSAIVGGSYLQLQPQASVHYGRTVLLARDGKTRSFCEDAQGFALSEALNIIFLQKAKDAKRIYAHVVHVKSKFTSLLAGAGGAPRYGFERDPAHVARFLTTFYDEAKVPPQAVEYVEAFGSANPDADKAELEAIEAVFCAGRAEPLTVGSVMSNIGYSESATGLSAITKVLLGYERGELAANLHCGRPRAGRVRVATQHHPFGRTYAAVSGLSLTGLNAHALLKGHYKPKDLTRYKSNIPRLVAVSGRHESAVERILNDLKSRPVDPEEIALLHSFHEQRTSGHMARGYTILDTSAGGETVCLGEKTAHSDDATRPLWFVYSGMGSQWPAMGKQLMRIPTFARAIQLCHEVLEPKGLDLINIITSPDKHIFDNILHSFVGIGAVQIGLTDVLREIGLVPDMIIGHSVGELGCAYADGCFSARETILCAYYRGLVSVQTELQRGSMAAVGIGYREISKMVPEEIEVACHNSATSSTISGPADAMQEFVASLTARGIFAKEVPCSNLAYHSRYIAPAGPKLLEYLSALVTAPKRRSARWLSTSIPRARWHEPSAQLCSAWYATNNLLNPVLFEETCELIPPNAVVVEVAPHGLLQAILKRSLAADCRSIALTKRAHPDNVLFMLEAVGSIFMEGYNPKISALYPPVEFPVSTNTPMLSHLVEWAHNDKWLVPGHHNPDKIVASTCKFVISVHDDEHSYLQGHVVRGGACYPFAACLAAVWEALSSLRGTAGDPAGRPSVQFRDVHLFAQPPLHDLAQLTLTVSIHKGSGLFEVTDEFSRVATGTVSLLEDALPAADAQPPPVDELLLSSEDVYQLLRERDYSYSGEFQSIHSTNATFTRAQLAWGGNYATLIDGALQLCALRRAGDAAALPAHIGRLAVDVAAHDGCQTVTVDGKTLLTAVVSPVHDLTRCGGVLLENVKFHDLPPATCDELEVKPLVSDSNAQAHETVEQQVDAERVVALQSGAAGDLGSLRWVEAAADTGPGTTVTVHYAGVSGLDARRATGAAPTGEGQYGMDFSGLTHTGARVMGAVRGDAARSRVRAGALLWPVPPHWSLEDAATVPAPYVHAFYCLGVKCQLLPGMTILVHGGAGALGQAAIAVALANGCEVFTTVGSLSKKNFLTRLFPELREDHIGNSRDRSFGHMVLRATKGKGCDIILGNVSEDLKNITLNCSAYCGVTLDTSQMHGERNYHFGMHHLTRQRSYVVVDIDSLFDRPDVMKTLQLMVSEGIARGYVRPLSRVTYPAREAARALRLLAASRHRGRALLALRGHSPPHATPRISCSAESSQVVVCDRGSFGVQWANRLVRRGARKLCLHCARPSAYLNLKVQAWQKLGVQVTVSSRPLNNNAGAAALLAACGPVEALYVASGELCAAVVCLDSVSRTLCPQLKYFGVLGAVGDAVRHTCVNRARDRLPATALYLPEQYIGEVETTSGGVNYRSALDACEVALRSAWPVLVAHARRAPPKDLLQDIADVAEVKVPANAPETTSLKDLNLDESKVEAISALLFNRYNVSLTEREISTLTIQKIREVERHVSGPQLAPAEGLGAMYSRAALLSDELLATTPVVFLPTLAHDAAMTNEEINPGQTYLYIVPGMEGHHGRFRDLCRGLKLPAAVLQPGLDHPHETLHETAQRYHKILTTKAVIGDNFYLLGYESGVIVALELAAILETQGLVGTVFCVGDSPAELQASLAQQLGALGGGERLDDAIILHFAALVAGAGAQDLGLEAALRGAGAWPHRLDAALRALEGRAHHSLQYTRALVDAARARIHQVQNYKVRPFKLRSRIIHLHPSTSTHGAMQQYSAQRVVPHALRTAGPHACADPRVSAAVNRYIGAALLEQFKARNRCETYLLDEDSFMKNIADQDDD